MDLEEFARRGAAAQQAVDAIAAEAVKIDTSNDHLVGVRGDMVSILLPPIGEISKPDALRLAAWLVVVADWSDGHSDFIRVLNAVEST